MTKIINKLCKYDVLVFGCSLHIYCLHDTQGWEKLTDAVIKWINDHLRNVVFLLWGSYAQKKGSSIDKVNIHGHIYLLGDVRNHMKF